MMCKYKSTTSSILREFTHSNTIMPRRLVKITTTFSMQRIKTEQGNSPEAMRWKRRGTLNLAAGELWRNIWNMKNSHLICFLFSSSSSSMKWCHVSSQHPIEQIEPWLDWVVKVNDNDSRSHYLWVHLPMGDHWPRVVKELVKQVFGNTEPCNVEYMQCLC